MCGAIRDEYNKLGGPGSFLSYPKSNELTNPDGVGKRTEFVGGNIYWTPNTGAHFVTHDFLTKWGQYNYERGFLKYPTTDEIVLGDTVSRRQEFQGGSMYFSFVTGVHTIYGLIKQAWVNLGAENSYLGFPTTDEQNTPTDSQRYKYGTRENQFQTGVIIANVKTGTTRVGNWAAASPNDAAARSRSAGAPSPSTLPKLQAKNLPSDPYSVKRYNPNGTGKPAAQARAGGAGGGYNCPDGTTDYSSLGTDKEVWQCESVTPDLLGYNLGIRMGFRTFSTTANDGKVDVTKGFGRLHAQKDHNVGTHTVQLIAQDNRCVTPDLDAQLLFRCQYTEVLVFGDEITDSITVVIQKNKDISEPQRSPDNYDVGLITAFCGIGQPEVGLPGYCRDDFPPPFEGGQNH